MRVLYSIPRYGEQFIGNETHGQVVRELRRSGLDVDVLSFTTRDGGGGPAGWGPGFEDEDVYRHVHSSNLGLRIASKLTSPWLHYDHVVSMATGLLTITRERSYDLLHIEGAYPLGAITALTQAIHCKPYIVTTTGGDLFTLPEQNYGYGQYVVPRKLISLALRKAAWIRANSALSLRLAVEYGADPTRSTVLPVSIGDACYPPDTLPLDIFRREQRTQLAAKYGWGNRPILMVVGRLFNLKAQELLIKALPHIHAAGIAAQAVIVGPSRHDAQKGDYRAFLEQTAAECGVTEWCTFTGFIANTEINTYLAAADLLIVPSLIEGLNRVVIEAAAVGTPSIVSDGAGAAELIASYGCGLIIPRGSEHTIAHAVQRVLTSPQAIAQFRQATYQLAHQQQAQHVAAGLQTMYHRVLTAPSNSPT